MIEGESQAKFLRIGTVVAFAFTLVFAIFFVYGYQFDARSQQIVRKSVVLFDGEMSDFQQSLDGKPLVPSQNELRLVPGEYLIALAQDGFHSWQKMVSLKEDELVRLGRPWLIPSSGIETSSDLLRKSGDTPREYTAVKNSQSHVFGIDADKKSVTVHVFSRTASDMPLVFTLKSPFTLKKIKKMAYVHEKLYVLGTDSQLWSFNDKKTPVKISEVRDMYEFDDALFVITAEGKLTALEVSATADSLFEKPVTVATPYELTSFTDVQLGKSNYLFTLNAEDRSHPKNITSVSYILITDSHGEQLFSDFGTAALIDSDDSFQFIQDGELVLMDLKKKSYQHFQSAPIFEHAQMVRRLGDTFWLLLVNGANTLSVCDQWGESCIVIATLDDPYLLAVSDGFAWLTTSQKKLLSLNFDPLNKGRSGISEIINTIIEPATSLTSSQTSPQVPVEEK